MAPSNAKRNARGHFVKKAIPADVRRELATRHGCEPGMSVSAPCAYCGAIGSIQWFKPNRPSGKGWVAFGDLEMDHAEPEYRGGATTTENIVLACRPCNRSKASKNVSEWRSARHG